MDIVPFAESTILILFLYEKCDNYMAFDKNTLYILFLTISLNTWGNEFIFYIIDKFQKMAHFISNNNRNEDINKIESFFKFTWNYQNNYKL